MKGGLSMGGGELTDTVVYRDKGKQRHFSAALKGK